MHNKSIEIDYDPVKNIANIEKHGVSFYAVINFEFDTALNAIDERYDYGEIRFRSLGFIRNRLYHLVYTLRNEGKIVRIISLRKANNREQKHYATYS